MRKTELLAPARNKEIGIEAFKHGADAVYIGAPAFSARAAAGNSVADIEALAQFGHQYGAKTIVAYNTILHDSELREAERLAWQLYEAGADALIIQDLGLLDLNLPPIELHASTQMDNRTPEKVRLLHDLGLTRVVMARELSVEQIRAIHAANPEVELECFVHGALCVSVSGQCYMSASLTGRSANRGECAQSCRLPMDLMDAEGRVLARQRHLLSLRDMNRSAYLEQLIDAGIYSLKIEGRLKDVQYVKNVTAYYRRLIDRLEGVSPASLGRSVYTFEPCVEKSFNRGFTPYFAEGKSEAMWNFETPKAIGERIGVVKEIGRDWFSINGLTDLHNGDGLAVGALGFRLNRFDDQLGRCYPLGGNEVVSQLRKGQEVRRNLDYAFDQLLSKPSATRRIPIEMKLHSTREKLTLSAGYVFDGERVVASCELDGPFETARTSQEENARRQLGKLGETVYELASLGFEGEVPFVPSSQLADLRRRVCLALQEAMSELVSGRKKNFRKPDYRKLAEEHSGAGTLPEDYHANVLNNSAREIYRLLGIGGVEDAFEIQEGAEGTVMQTRHCLKYAFGFCSKYHNPSPEPLPEGVTRWTEPLTLGVGKRKFILKFGCKSDCISEIITTFAPQKT